MSQETVENSSANVDSNSSVPGSDQVATQNAAPSADQPATSSWAMVKGFLFRMVIMYLVMSFFRRSTSPSTTGEVATGALAPSTNLYEFGKQFDLYFYLSENETVPDFSDPTSLFWKQQELVYGDWTGGPSGDGLYSKNSIIRASQNLMNNGSVYLHVYMVPNGWSPNPADKGKHGAVMTIHKVKKLNKIKKRKFVNTVNLLTGQTDAHPDLIQKDNTSSVELLSHWHPNLTVNVIADQTPWISGSVPAPLDEFIEFVPKQNKYYPVIFFNDYWNLQTDYKPINETTPELNFSLSVYPLSLIKWQFYAAQGMKKNWYSSLLGDGGMEQPDEEQDSLKQTMLETNPYLLAITVAVSIVHSVFEFLAFKNDIQFWRNRKTLEGLSVRSVFMQVFQSLIVLLYILDNETNIVVIISVGIGLLIELWKITKVIDIKLDFEDKWFDSIPRIVMTDKSTYITSKTKEYDQQAFKYLSWALFPLLASYGVYSLIYNEHKGWYSWVLSMLYGFLLLFGFIGMTPQLFINYKLKSVAHLPWRMMTYKALNTFIDDLFAFVIKMPTLYRLGCFRDDIIFVIFLYQRWIYKVDPTRVNEFGTSGEDNPSQSPEQMGESEPLAANDKKND